MAKHAGPVRDGAVIPLKAKSPGASRQVPKEEKARATRFWTATGRRSVVEHDGPPPTLHVCSSHTNITHPHKQEALQLDRIKTEDCVASRTSCAARMRIPSTCQELTTLPWSRSRFSATLPGGCPAPGSMISV